MPIKILNSMPAQATLESENIFVMTEYRAMHQDIRPLKVLILNLMPTKIETETQILRKLSNSPLQVDVDFLQTASYTPQHIDKTHLDSFYSTFDEIKNKKYDGMIITGAPLERIRYEEVDYWDELCRIMDWTDKHVHSTYYLCWGAYAAFYHYYGIDKRELKTKLSGIYPHRLYKKTSPLFRGFDDVFYAPHSREIEVTKEDIESVKELELMAWSDEAGVSVVKTKDSRRFFVTCHFEYDADTLKKEYLRDKGKGLNPELPKNYFPDDDPEKEPVVNWRSAAQLFYTNWLNYYVYQSTPYEIEKIAEDDR
ncbi:MAG: homoserine O-succinyltransferase [Lachnospiraceae bacterium]|nr:homoserine O-succinyltransferase [Lachnospiraceae bacterium]